jgi:hypothetical protein
MKVSAHILPTTTKSSYFYFAAQAHGTSPASAN